ncbi:uncharacterized protein TNCV_4956851 [Trichonephila clavipes]|nr:uncharacterized protein TNCV_4956851 [Trichonephila clavipes]
MACERKLLESEATTGFFVLLGTKGKKETLEWCMKANLIASRYECPRSKKEMRLTVTNDVAAASRKIIPTTSFGVKEVAEASMQSAALEEVILTNSSDIIISGDGTWKTRGYSSRVGVCAVIGDKARKCIDAEVMSSFCEGCDSWKRRKGSPAYKK